MRSAACSGGASQSGWSPRAPSQALFDALAGFHRAHPGVSVTLVEDDSAALVERVRSGTADLALIGAAGRLPPDLDGLAVVSERLAAAVPPGHPLLAGREPREGLDLADLAGHPVICLPVGTGIRAVLDGACAVGGVRLDMAFEASAPSAVADLAVRGLGIAVLSETMAAHYSARLRAMPLRDIGTPALLALIWKPEPASAQREFLLHCRQAFTATAPGPSPAGSLPGA